MNLMVRHIVDAEFSTQQILDITGVDKMSFNRFLTSNTGVTSQILRKGGYHNSENIYGQQTLADFKIWLMKNQANQGRRTQAKKEVTNAVAQNLVLMQVANSGNKKLQTEYLMQMQEMFDSKNNLLEVERQKEAALIERDKAREDRQHDHLLVEQKYKSATEIGKILGISKIAVGKIANELDLDHKGIDYIMWKPFKTADGFVGQSRVYSPRAIDLIADCLELETFS